MLAASQGIEFLKPLKGGGGTSLAYKEIRKVVPPLEKDRVLYKDIDKVIELVESGALLEKVEKKVKLA